MLEEVYDLSDTQYHRTHAHLFSDSVTGSMLDVRADFPSSRVEVLLAKYEYRDIFLDPMYTPVEEEAYFRINFFRCR